MPLHHGLRAAAGALLSDPYFSSTSLLLSGNGTNGGQNNTFVDSSTNNFTVTRSGNAAQGSFSPFSAPDGRWSNYFDGSGDYLTGPSNSAFSFGTSDFTAECWVYFTSLPTANQSLFDFRNGSDNSSFFMGVYSNNIPFFANQSGGVLNGSFTFNVNTWYHIAYTRSGTSLNIWVNGTNVGATTNSTNLTGTNCKIGADASGAYNVFGYISNARVLKNTAQYTAAFTPPSAPLTAITNTSLLTCQSNSFKDNSSNAFTVTPSGNAAVTSFSPFAPLAEYSANSNGGSGYFDGSGDYLDFGNQTALHIGSGNYTVEMWIYKIANNAYMTACGDLLAGSTNTWQIIGDSTGNKICWYNGASNSFSITSTASIPLSTWTHIAFVRSGSTLTLFINGSSDSTATVSTDYNAATSFFVGNTPELISNRYWSGYLSSLRILKGTAQYTATFTPPTSPLTAITNTSLLLNFTNASILDSTAKNDLETVGDAQISTSVKKFGTGSMAFDGTGDYLQGPSSGNLNFGTGDFTVECWIYLNSTTSSQVIINGTASNSFGLRYGTGYLANNGLGLFRASIADLEYCSFTFSTGQWYHIAVVRASSVIKYFVDGVQKTTQGSGGSSYSFGAETNIRVALADNNGEPFNGYIDDLRITKGVARYTSNFTPPSAQLPAR